MSKETITSVLSFGTKLNGWLKIALVIGSMIAAVVTLRADVAHVKADVARVENQAKEARDNIEARTVKELTEIKEMLRDINQHLLRRQ